MRKGPKKDFSAPFPFTERQKELFHDKVEKIGSDPGCWIWMGGVSSNGYGAFAIERRLYGAHRISYALHRGVIPKDLCVCHWCNTKSCVNPAHLYIATSEQNSLDALASGLYECGESHWSSRRPDHVPRGSDKVTKLTESQVREIRKRVSEGEKQKHVAQDYSITACAVWKIVNYEIWAHLK